MKRFLVTVLSLALFSLFITSGCVNASKLIVTGLDIEVTGIERAADGSVDVTWQFKSSNVVPYLFSHLTHKIQLNGTLLGTISEKEALALPANSHAGRTSKLTNLDANASRALTDALAAGSANYRIDSQITVLIYDNDDEKSALSHSGTVSVTKK